MYIDLYVYNIISLYNRTIILRMNEISNMGIRTRFGGYWNNLNYNDAKRIRTSDN